MADVTVKQLAQVVGVSVERLLTQLQDANLNFMDENQLVSEEQKRILLNYLKTSQEQYADKITLKRTCVTQVTLGYENSKIKGYDSNKTKVVKIEIRKKRTYLKQDSNLILDEPNNDSITEELTNNIENTVFDQTESMYVNSKDNQHQTIDNLQAENVDPLNINTENPLIATAIIAPKAEIYVDAVKTVEKSVHETSKAHRNNEVDLEDSKNINKRRHNKNDPADSGDFRRNKQKNKYILSDLTNEDDVSQGLHKRYKNKKAKDDKVDKYRAAEESMTHAFALPITPAIHEVVIPETITVAELAKRMSIKAAELIKTMMKLGAIVTINQVIDQTTAAIVVEELGHIPKILNDDAIEHTLGKTVNKGIDTQNRAPVVTIMGHVDHGKTSLLDYIRRTKIAAGEAGGITQHIGAYHVHTPKGDITFLDTPGHAAFTAMRARGAQITDIVILIVAADDGVKPQTIEAIHHAKAAKVPIIVAINKIDKHDANPEQVINELSNHEVISEAWGGDTLFVNISAKTGLGIDNLLDAILLQSEVLELQAVVDGAAHGIVIESRIDKGRGPVATILVKSGTLHKGDILLAGFQYGRVRILINDAGLVVDNAKPSIPVEVIGLSAIPHAGDIAVVVPNEKKAREVALFRQGKFRDIKLAKKQKTSLEGLIENMTTTGDIKILNVVLKADVQGSIEAIIEALTKLSNEEVKVEVISSGVGGITASDVHLALASHAFLIGFNVRADNSGKRLAEQESITIYYYSVIYEIVDHIKGSLFGMLAPKFKEEIVGIAEVRDVFRSPKLGAIAGCMVIEGIVKRNNPIRVLRDNVVIYEGVLESLRRFKDDAGEVRQGIECGIGVKNYNDIKIGDLIEVFDTIEIVREL